jgi:hypothetical protein
MKKLCSIAVALILSVLGPACSNEPASTGADEQRTTLSAEQVAERTGFRLDAVGEALPTLALVEGYLNQHTGHARLLLQMECLVEKGDLTAARYLSAPGVVHYPTRHVRTSESVFTAEIARTYGYSHPDPPEDLVLDALPAPTSSVEEQGKCGDAADRTLAAPVAELQFVNDVRMAGWKATYTGKRFVPVELQELAAKWKKCMAPLGVPDLPDDPFGMPPESIAPAAVDPSERMPSAHELTVATKDFECRESVGLIEAEWKNRAVAELESIGRSWERWQSALPEIAEYLDRCEDVIARLGS